MAIDDPIRALEQQFEMEDLSSSPVTKKVLHLVSLFQLIWPFNKLAETLTSHLAADSMERIRLMLETFAAEISKHSKELEQLRKTISEQEAQAREEVSRELLLDAARKAENTRAKDRVKRIGLILANSVTEPKHTDADEVEEMMRVAMELSDRDIQLLRELVRIEGPTVQAQGRIERYDAQTRWEQGSWGTKVDPELDSVFSKLESYGLVSRIPPSNNLNIMADFQNRYVLLRKGLRFVSLIQSVTRS
jgi:chemotaxis protein histidine kinase CheA